MVLLVGLIIHVSHFTNFNFEQCDARRLTGRSFDQCGARRFPGRLFRPMRRSALSRYRTVCVGDHAIGSVYRTSLSVNRAVKHVQIADLVNRRVCVAHGAPTERLANCDRPC